MKKLKKLSAVLAVLAMMASLAGGIPAVQNTEINSSLVAVAETSEDGVWEYRAGKKNPDGTYTYEITGYHSTETDIVIPSEIDGITVIGVSIFSSGWDTLPTSIVLPSTIETFSASGAETLESVTVAEDNPYYTSIDGILYDKDVTELKFFPRKKSLSDFTLPESVTILGSNVFSGRNDLTSFTIPNGITTISRDAFSACSRLTSIKIPDSVTRIDAGAFRYCSNLETIEFNGKFSYVSGNAFQGTPWLTNQLAEKDFVTFGDALIAVNPTLKEESSIIIPADLDVTLIGCQVFYNFENLTSVEIPDGITVIGNGAFWNCTNLTSVSIPDSVVNIEDAAFGQCSSLTSIEIPDSVTRIGGWAFYSCTALEDVRMSANIQEFGAMAFGAGVPWLANATQENPLLIVNGILIYVNPELTNGKIVVSDNVTTIHDSVSTGKVTSLFIPASVKAISTGAFNSTGIEVYYAGSEADWEAIEFFIPSNIDRGDGMEIRRITAVNQYGTIHYNCDSSAIDEMETNPPTEEPSASEQPSSSEHPSETPSGLIPGDANGDGKVSILDVIAVNKAIMGKASLTDEQLKAIDFNENNKPDPEESLKLLEYIVGLIDAFE